MSIWTRMRGIPDASPIPFPPMSPEGLAARWVQWGAATRTEKNPIADTTGEHAGAQQPNDVWFLAGAFGGSVRRACTIPAGRGIFLPVVNVWAFGGYQLPDQQIYHGLLKVDDKQVEPDFIETQESFVVKGVWGNPVTGSIFARSLVVGGLWRFIEPLSPGPHEIYFRGGLGKEFSVEATYRITVGSA